MERPARSSPHDTEGRDKQHTSQFRRTASYSSPWCPSREGVTRTPSIHTQSSRSRLEPRAREEEPRQPAIRVECLVGFRESASLPRVAGAREGDEESDQPARAHAARSVREVLGRSGAAVPSPAAPTPARIDNGTNGSVKYHPIGRTQADRPVRGDVKSSPQGQSEQRQALAGFGATREPQRQRCKRQQQDAGQLPEESSHPQRIESKPFARCPLRRQR